MARHSRRNSAAALGLIIVALVTFLQNTVDLLQSYSSGSYAPTWQRILISVILILSLVGLVLSYRGGGRGLRRR